MLCCRSPASACSLDDKLPAVVTAKTPKNKTSPDRPILSALSIRTSPCVKQDSLNTGSDHSEIRLSHVKSMLGIDHNLKVIPRSPAKAPVASEVVKCSTNSTYMVSTQKSVAASTLAAAPSALFCRTPRQSRVVFSQSTNRHEASLSNLPRQLSCKTPTNALATFQSPGKLGEGKSGGQRVVSLHPKPFVHNQTMQPAGKGTPDRLGILSTLSVPIKRFSE